MIFLKSKSHHAVLLTEILEWTPPSAIHCPSPGCLIKCISRCASSYVLQAKILPHPQGWADLRSSCLEVPQASQCFCHFVFFFWFVFCFLGPHLWHMEVPRLGVESELQLLSYTTVIAMQDRRHICNLHHSSQQCQIPDPLSEARDWTHILMDTSQICFHWAMMGIPCSLVNGVLLAWNIFMLSTFFCTVVCVWARAHTHTVFLAFSSCPTWVMTCFPSHLPHS